MEVSLLEQFKEVIAFILDMFLHLDKNLAKIVSEYGTLTYVILFAIIFMETGLVVTPFLPGDSLLFATGAIVALPSSNLNIWLMGVLLFVAAVLGDTVNYAVGNYLGARAFQLNTRFIKQEHLQKTQMFYEKHGGKTIIFARFIPIIRTFAPFVAGVGRMNYSNFITYNIVGGFLWVSIFLAAGYFFGETPLVRKNFTLVIFAIIILSVLPAVIEILRAKYTKSNS
jgi:membrane-associated protein